MERICVDTISKAWQEQQTQSFNKYFFNKELARDKSIRYVVQTVHDVD